MATSIETLNSLLRGEISAVETYQQALDKVRDESGKTDLSRIQAEHREAANLLRQQIQAFGGQPEQGSGAWGAFAKAVEGVAKAFGNRAALRALKEGEVHGRNVYENALENEELAMACKEVIRSRLLPQTREHIAALDAIMFMAS